MNESSLPAPFVRPLLALEWMSLDSRPSLDALRIVSDYRCMCTTRGIMRATMFSCAVTVAVLLAGCDSNRCEARTTRPCHCPEGGLGIETCNAEGAGWGECQCTRFSSLTVDEIPTEEEIEQLRRELQEGASRTKTPPPQKAPVAEETANSQSGPTLTPPRPPEPMVQQILGQKVLTHPQVAMYLHTEVAANLPLTVHAVSGLEQGAPRLTAAGQPVRVTPTASEARFRFTSRERIGPARVRIGFEIPAEGVVGHVDLELRDYVWGYLDARVVEQ